MLAQQQTLQADLHALRLIRSLRHVRRRAALVIHRDHALVIRLDHVHTRRHSKLVRAEQNGACVQARHLNHLLRLRHAPMLLIHTPVHESSVERVRIVRPFALHMFQIKQAWAVGIFINHPRRNLLDAFLIALIRCCGFCRHLRLAPLNNING